MLSPRRGDGEALVRGLGWFSVGLGAMQLAAPGMLARAIGFRGTIGQRALIRGIGMRELAAGFGILRRPRSSGWLWARAVGDAMDLGLLASAFTSPKTNKGRAALATAAVLGVSYLDLAASMRTGSRRSSVSPPLALPSGRPSTIHVTESITVQRPIEEVYAFWRALENLPRFLGHLESVQMLDARRSHWKAKGPAGTHVEWDAETIVDRPDEMIAWRSTPDASVENAGVVRFRRAPVGSGTEIHVEMDYRPPGGPVGAAFTKLFGRAPEQRLRQDLRTVKQVLELGEVVKSDASIHRLPHPARPSEGPIER